jgi:hypothetical protein
MIIPGPDTTSIKENPGAGRSFAIGGEWKEYLWNYRDLFENTGITVNISPPVLNTDNDVVYAFPNPGGDDMNARQTAGLWIQPLTGSDYLTGYGTFDQKKSFNSIYHIATQTAYNTSDGGARKSSSPQTITGSFVTGSTSPYDEYEFYETSVDQAVQAGTSVENPNSFPFNVAAGRSDLQLLSYDLQWGNDNAANYGPFNFSSGDLLTMGTYLQEGLTPGLSGRFASFSVDRSRGNARGPYVVATDVINPNETNLEPVLMELTSSVDSRFDVGSNMHISYTKTFTRYRG